MLCLETEKTNKLETFSNILLISWYFLEILRLSIEDSDSWHLTYRHRIRSLIPSKCLIISDEQLQYIDEVQVGPTLVYSVHCTGCKMLPPCGVQGASQYLHAVCSGNQV